MNIKALGKFGAFLCTAAFAVGATHAQPRPTEAELYEKAKGEGSVTWYVGYYTTALADSIRQDFEKKYPGVKVNVIKTTGQVAFQRVMQDIKSQSIQSDLFSSPDVGHFEVLKKENALLPFIPPNSAKLSKEFQNLDPDNNYHVTWAMVIALSYNTDKVKTKDAPRSWQDLLDPKWKNQISLGNPNYSSSAAVWALAMRKQFGDAYLTKLAEQNPLVSRSIDDTVNVLNSGERMVAVSGIGTAARSLDKGNPIGMAYPSDGSILLSGPSAVLKNSNNPNAGMLLLNYLMGTENDGMLASYFGQPIRSDTPPSKGMQQLDNVPTSRLEFKELVDGLPAVRTLWREKFGN